LSNRESLSGRKVAGRVLEVDVVPTWSVGLWRKIRVAKLWKYDAVVVDVDTRWLMLICAVRKILPFVRCRIMCIDLVLTRPRGIASYTKFLIRRWLLTEVDRFLFYFRQTDDLQRVYAIRSNRIAYVPFKVNTFDALMRIRATDEGFFLACGRSNRDFGTLLEAFRRLPYECRVLAPWDDLERHGTSIEGVDRPNNVSLVVDDGTTESWNGWIARARAVVLPIQPGMLSPSGISTYLVAMALKKCVIITEGPATWQILNADNAVLVPPRDADALATAIAKVAEDHAFRDAVASRGQEYALSLGGEERLRNDVLNELMQLLA
jgi:glycosyltransferase involved in cell wall biosynthesis